VARNLLYLLAMLERCPETTMPGGEPGIAS
jgi:hypothetical protein